MSPRPTGYVRKTKQWLFLPGTSQAFTASATADLGSLAFTEAQTVLRMLGEYQIHRTAAIVQFDSAHFGVGIGIVSSDAVAAGNVAMPDPRDEPEFPWLYWADHLVTYRGTETEPEALDGSGFIRRTFDIRSMRKVKPRESLVFVVQYVDGGGAPPLTFVHQGIRVLVAVH